MVIRSLCNQCCTCGSKLLNNDYYSKEIVYINYNIRFLSFFFVKKIMSTVVGQHACSSTVLRFLTSLTLWVELTPLNRTRLQSTQVDSTHPVTTVYSSPLSPAQKSPLLYSPPFHFTELFPLYYTPPYSPPFHFSQLLSTLIHSLPSTQTNQLSWVGRGCWYIRNKWHFTTGLYATNWTDIFTIVLLNMEKTSWFCEPWSFHLRWNSLKQIIYMSSILPSECLFKLGSKNTCVNLDINKKNYCSWTITLWGKHLPACFERSIYRRSHPQY